MKYPDNPVFKAKMEQLLGDEYQAYLNSFEKPAFNGLRVNTQKISVADFLKIVPFKLKPIPWTSDGFYYCGDDRPSKHPFYYAGLYYLQEPSAMLPAESLPIEDGDIVLDSCAAPGGKSTKLAVKLNGSGLLVSNDISASRANALLRNIERFGTKNAYVLSEDLTKLTKQYPNFFDKIIIDAPCSGEGMFRKDPDMLKNYQNDSPEKYHIIQKQIIEIAYQLLNPGGEMVYSTCTFDIQENEAVIYQLLCQHQDMEVLPILVEYPGFSKGLAYKGENSLTLARRLYPHKLDGEGHFVCRLKKQGKKEVVATDGKFASCKIEACVLEFLKLINWDFSKYQYLKIKDECYLIPTSPFKAQKIRILRSGLHIGSLKHGSFIPSQALAMALKHGEYANIINLNVDDERVIRYLKGETITLNESYQDGYYLIMVDNYSLGFAKITKGLFKNKLDRGWIYR